jgi:protein tyrosine phosphatase (PTP) superfamily phosphohydrolase (DUF442 family)
MREVSDKLWVAGLEEAREWGDAVDLVIDCLTDHEPTGRTSHEWTPDDLDAIVARARVTEGDVLIHCRSGKSRSACAAAAVLLDRGEAEDPTAAMRMARMEGSRMNPYSVRGLREWWDRRQQAGLFR